MKQKINIAELLKDAPKGTKLYALDEGEVELAEIYTGQRYYEIHVKDTNGNSAFYTSYGKTSENGECLLFPSKDCCTWENFNAPWKHNHFEPFQKVLINCCGKWVPCLYGYCTTLDNGVVNHVTCNGVYILDGAILPYEGNEDKLGKEVG